MVLSNKKLKEKLRAAKAELMAASEAQNHSSNENPEHPDSIQTGSLKNLFNSVTKTPKLSKREKRREKTHSDLQETAEAVKCGENGGKEEGEEKKNEKKKKKKRKRDESKEMKNVEEEEKVEQLKKRKKTKKKKRKAIKKVENGGIEEQVVAEVVVGDESKQDLKVSNKVYVGGIPYYSTEDDIRSYFEGCGTITEVDCLFFPESGKFRGIAIISFKTEAAAKRALALDGSDMGGLYLKIQPYKSTSRVSKVSNFSPSVVEGYNRIYVGNLSWDITEDDLRKLFSDLAVTSIRFGEDKESGEFKGYAHVDFADNLSLNMALKMDQKIVCERPVRISCAVPKKGDATKPKFIPRNDDQVDTTTSADQVDTTTSANQVDSSGVSATVSSKIRRRTCYECGERGHLSSSCPKKQAESTSC